MNYFVLVISVFVILIGFLASLTLIFRRNGSFSFRLLGVWMLCLISLLVYTNLVANATVEYKSILLFRIPSLVMYLVPPISFVFFRSLLNNETKFKRWDWLHLLPFLLHALELTPFFLNGRTLNPNEFDIVTKAYKLSLVSEGLLPKQAHVILKSLSMLIYAIFSIRLYFKFKNQHKNETLAQNILVTNFVRNLLIIKVINVLLIVTTIFLVLSKNSNGLFVIEYINAFMLVYITSYLYYHPIILYGLKNSISDNLIVSKIELISKKLQSSLFSATESILFLDPNFTVLHFNILAGHQFQNKFQKTLITGIDYRQYIQESNAALFKENFQKAVNGEQNSISVENSANNSSEKNWIQLSFIPVYDDAKNLLGISVVTIDIHETKSAEEDNSDYALRLKEITWRQSHLIRAPIANLLGITKLLNKPNSTIDEAEKLLLIAQVEKEVKRLDDEINGLFSQPKSN
ncbi:MAG: PAS domain-containing protein [Bacteroidetes bacterium]|nr:PAS domain-containing protein [Bacteroidota bacterium]